ncbi:MAG: sigma-70 family RNA polymerase sigma factor [Lachnospiraceae bacterium]|nr:sigma-70 family RNA polymerase sigma factor [Lachnospiraceae bacterium]
MDNEINRVDADIGNETGAGGIGSRTDAVDTNETYDIETLMRQYGNDVLRTAYSYVNDRLAAEDCFQEAFIKAYKNLKNFRGESSVKTWLIRITVNVCKDYLKSAYQKHVVPMMEFEEDAIVSENDFEEVENKDRNRQILDAVNSLPEHYREVIMCVFYNEMSIEETAASIGVAAGTVKSRLHRAKEQLKNILEGRL